MPSAEVKDERAVQLGEWLSAWRRKRGLNRPETVNEALKYDPRAKLSPDYLSKIEYGKRSLASASPEVREALRLALNISRETWENETGLLVPAAVIEIAAPTSYGNGAAPAGLRHRDEVIPVHDLHRIPVRGMAAAGPAFYGDDNILGYEYVEDENYRSGMLSVQIDGDSMEPTIPHGSRVYIDSRNLEPQDGKMYLIHITDDGLVVKRAKKVSGNWFLMSDNPNYQAFTPDEASIIGEVYYIQPRGWKP